MRVRKPACGWSHMVLCSRDLERTRDLAGPSGQGLQQIANQSRRSLRGTTVFLLAAGGLAIRAGCPTRRTQK